ncbi:MAG: peptidoglycan bridge formation glycyltransferase FemA/FemB family protein [bacterium]|nr:peptidoglycan bridge formation glycyltransferase FemA/FemB family protein [bacterium]
MDIRQSDLWAKYLQELGWQTIPISPLFQIYLRKVPFFGATAKLPKLRLPIPFKEIGRVAAENNIFMLKLEPDIEAGEERNESVVSLLKANGFQKDRWALSPTRTIQIDLTKSEEDLLKGMEKDTRYNVRLAAKRGVIVRKTNDFAEFKNLYFNTAKRKGFWPARKEIETLWRVFSREKAANILTAYYKGRALASTILLDSNEVGYYQHAASSTEHREVMAPYLLLWEAMKFIKNKGCKMLDLEGIYDPRMPSTKKWKGFTLFKRGFGGREVEYIGSFVKYPRLWSKLLFLPTRVF